MASTTEDPLPDSSLSSISSLMALQLFSRLFTFILNQALFRLASPSAFGAAAIQFELILSTILFLSREGVRNALLRVNKDSSNTMRQRMNLTFLPIMLGVPLALGTSFLYARFSSQEMKAQPHFNMAISLYALAAFTELLSEPMHNIAMSRLLTGIRVRAEGLSITSKSLVTFLVLLLDARSGQGNLALLAFAIGQLAYATTLFLAYISYFGTDMFWSPSQHYLPIDDGRRDDLLDGNLLKLALTMMSQSVIKHFLTEGDKMVLSWYSPLRDQGGYAIAVNYGSLIARIVFQPIEETLRVFFSKTISVTDNKGKTKDEALKQASVTLLSLLTIQTSFSLVFVIFATAYLPILLPILLPPQYLATSAPTVLAAWIWYIPVLAFNGGLEAFLSSVATPADLNKQSRWMIGFSVVYISTAIFLYSLDIGDASLVYANVINLSARILYCLAFVMQFFAKSSPPQTFQSDSDSGTRRTIRFVQYTHPDTRRTWCHSSDRVYSGVVGLRRTFPIATRT
ncbi:hypothetical protein K443DRAFT_644720 [Laccaria amethystina LaAM-08-1]|uniref:Man(5)GlcNAc(2)-PP-dolichol translocation protein RFT1 n=1 Tax=Laccaria amethystina LaAM-08-1 TaxID=1095629 RepID=A0A0C9Y6B8_9AGAR|nr:hypothetical protein K443DRAFT_644720 [Laccaria amethystina LaAM-08-1]